MKLQRNIYTRLMEAIQSIELRTGKKVLNLTIGSPDIAPSPTYVAKFKEFISEPDSFTYPGHIPYPEFISGLQDWYSNRFSVSIANNELLPLLGSRDGVSHMPLALCKPGDEILVPNPGYSAYSSSAKLFGVKPLFYDLTDNTRFLPDIDQLGRLVTAKTRYIWVNFPANPTGKVASLDDLQPLVAFAKRHKIWLLYDNAYAEITFDKSIAPSILQIEGAIDIAVEIGTCSKMFSFAGLRMGWIVGNSTVISSLAALKSLMDSGMNSALQRLAGFALSNPDNDWRNEMIDTYSQRRLILKKNFEALGLVNSDTDGSLYLWMKIPQTAKNSETFASELLDKRLIAVTPGIAFGSNGDRYIRVCICASIETISRYFKL